MFSRLVILLGLLSLVSAVPKYVPAEDSTDQLTTLMKTESSLDFSRIRALAHSDAGEAWHHTADLFFAVHAGKNEYVVVDAVKDTKGWDFSSFEDLKTRAIYETKTSYKLLPQVVSLDQHDAKSVNDISSVHLEHCSSDRQLREGDLVIGSSHGAWYKSASVQPKLSTAGLLKTHAEADKHAIVLARRVLSVKTLADGGCVSATTESLHPLELFETMDIESSGYRPFHDVSVPLAVPTEERERELQNVANPDAPIVACPDFVHTKGKQFTQGTASGVSYNLGSKGGCLQYNYNIGSISMNYNWNSRAASKTKVQLSQGLRCKDCFLYTGAGFLVIAQYVTGSYLRAEIKVAGGAGFNLNLAASNPTITGSKSIQILSEGSWQKISLGPSLSFQYAMGGVQADVSGSGTAVGSGFAIAGAQAQASAGFAYSGGKSWTPVSAFKSYKAPSVSMKFTSARPTAAMVMLTGTLLGKIVLGGAVGSLSGHVDLTASANLDYKTSSMTSLSAAVASSRSLLSGTRDAQMHAVGALIPIDSSYSGLVPNEEHFLFFSLLTPDGLEIPIHEDRFTSSSDGKGTHRSQWKVPSDSRMQSGAGYRIRVRASNLYSRQVDTQPFGLNVFDPEHDPLIQSPRGGDVFQAGSRMQVKWDPSALHYFKKNGPMRGKHFKTRKVTFELHGEKDGGEKGSTRRGLNVGDRHDWENSGNAEIQIPEDFSRRFDRFYVQVHDAEADEVGGWNTGFFYVHHQKQQQAQNRLRAPASRRRSVKPRPPQQDKQLQVVNSENRALQSCKSKFYFGFGVVASGGADSFDILLFSVPLGIEMQPVPLLPVKVVCV